MKKTIIISLILFCMCSCIGTVLSIRRSLWNDEIYSQNAVIHEQSYLEMLTGKIKDGNNYPLFYAIQKVVTDITGYDAAARGVSGSVFSDRTGQIILRIAPNICMSLAIVIIFYYFASVYSLGIGFYALITTMVSYMVWAYWAEARPYALYFLLTTVHFLQFIHMSKKDRFEKKDWRSLTVIHILLSLTTIFGAFQIAAVSLFLFVFKEKSWKKYIMLTLVPLLIIFFYYANSMRFEFYFKCAPIKLVYSSIPIERLIFLTFGILVTLPFLFLKKRLKDSSCQYLLIAMSVTTFCILFYMFLGDTKGASGFEISHRYFIYLAPIGIIAMVLLTLELWGIFKDNLWMRINIAVLAAGSLIINFLGSVGGVSCLI